MTPPKVRVWREVELKVGKPEDFAMDDGGAATYMLRLNSERGAGMVEFCKPMHRDSGPAIAFFWADVDDIHAALEALKER